MFLEIKQIFREREREREKYSYSFFFVEAYFGFLERLISGVSVYVCLRSFTREKYESMKLNASFFCLFFVLFRDEMKDILRKHFIKRVLIL